MIENKGGIYMDVWKYVWIKISIDYEWEEKKYSNKS